MRFLRQPVFLQGRQLMDISSPAFVERKLEGYGYYHTMGCLPFPCLPIWNFDSTWRMPRQNASWSTSRLLSEWCGGLHRGYDHLWEKRRNVPNFVGLNFVEVTSGSNHPSATLAWTILSSWVRVFSESGMQLSNERVQGIRKIPEPNSLKAVRSFARLVNYFWGSIMDYWII